MLAAISLSPTDARAAIDGNSSATSLKGAKIAYTGPIFVIEAGESELWFSKGVLQSGFDFFTLDYYTRCMFNLHYNATADDQQIILSSDAGIELEITGVSEYRDERTESLGLRFALSENPVFENLVCYAGTMLSGCGFGEIAGSNLKVKNVRHQLGKYFTITVP